MKNKGFTLIELLAVIVILAIIALIATPIVMNIIADSKEGANKQSAINYNKVVEQKVAASYMDTSNKIEDNIYELTTDGKLCIGTWNGTNCSGIIEDIEVNGTKPSKGIISIENGNIGFGSTLVINDNQYVYNGSEYVKATDLNCFPKMAGYGNAISAYTCTNSDIVIPAYDSSGIKSTEISIATFSSKNLTNVIIPISIIGIYPSAFKGNLNLTSITIPKSVIEIGQSAFYDTGLKTIINKSSFNNWGPVFNSGAPSAPNPSCTIASDGTGTCDVNGGITITK